MRWALVLAMLLATGVAQARTKYTIVNKTVADVLMPIVSTRGHCEHIASTMDLSTVWFKIDNRFFFWFNRIDYFLEYPGTSRCQFYMRKRDMYVGAQAK